MALPPNAKIFSQAMDPSDIADFSCTLTQGDDDTNLLRTGENVASFTLAATAEAVAAGLIIMQSADRAPRLANLVLAFWLSVDPAQQSAAIFAGDGAQLAIELTIVTDAVPSRKRQRTMIVKVAQQ